ncbi:MAG: hypothetical protein JWQ71_215, partial [Pedosphaera sp.]|nr:hypothetical protein [Pedosphaera sp.]
WSRYRRTEVRGQEDGRVGSRRNEGSGLTGTGHVEAVPHAGPRSVEMSSSELVRVSASKCE